MATRPLRQDVIAVALAHAPIAGTTAEFEQASNEVVVALRDAGYVIVDAEVIEGVHAAADVLRRS